MKCKDVIRDLSDYLDGDLEPSVVGEIRRHMEHCEDCRWVVDTTRKTINLYCNSEPAPLPDDIRDRLHKALEKRLRPRSQG